MKIAYFGSPSFSATLLEKLILDKSLGIEVALVVTQPDKPVGRKMIMTASPVKVVAQKYGIPIFDNLKLEIRNLKSSSNDKLSKNLNINNLDLNKNLKFQISNLDLCLVYAYGFKQLIPLDLLQAPKIQFEVGEGKTSGFVNVHPSLLPLYRGSSPIAYPISLGENKTGVTLFVMDEKMDHGPIIDQQEMKITLTDVRSDMEKKLTDLGFDMVKKWISVIARNEITKQSKNEIAALPAVARNDIVGLTLKPQLHKLSTRAPYMTKDDGFIPLSVLQKALKNEPLTITELPQIMRKYLSRHPERTLRFGGEVEGSLHFGRDDAVSNSAKIIYNFWRGMYPWPGLWTLIRPPRLDTVHDDRTAAVKTGGKKRLKILNLQLYNFKTLKLVTVQLEGKSPIDFPTFQKAYKIFE